MDLSGLAALTSSVGPGYAQGQEQQLRLAAMRLRQQQEQEQMAGQGAFARSLLDQPGGGGAPPMAPVPGATPMPQPGGPSMPPPQGGGGPGGRPPVMPAQMRGPIPQMPAQAGPQQPQAQPPQAPPQAQPPQGGAPGGLMTIQQMAQRIKGSNPNISDGQLFAAIQQGQALLLPEERIKAVEASGALKLQIEMSKLSNQATIAIMKAQSAEEVAKIRADTAQQLGQLASQWHMAGTAEKGREADQKDATTQRGQDKAGERAALGAESREKVAETGAVSREKIADKKLDAGTVGEQRKGYATEIRAINTKISEVLHGRSMADLTPEEKKSVQDLQKARDGIVAKDKALVAKLGKGADAPPLKSFVNEAPLPPAEEAAAPEGAPDAATLPDGQTGTDAQGVKWVVKNKQWMKAGG